MNFSSLGDHSIQAREPEQWLSRGQEDQPRTQLGSLMLGRGPQLGWPAVGFKLSGSELKLCWSQIETSGFSKITWQHKPAVPWYSRRPQGGLRGCWQRRCSRRRCCQRRRQGGRRRIWKPSLRNINWRICRHQLLSQALVLELDLCDKGRSTLAISSKRHRNAAKKSVPVKVCRLSLHNPHLALWFDN